MEKVLGQGKICILDIDVQGAEQVKKATDLKPFFVFIAPPSKEELEKRLRGRYLYIYIDIYYLIS